MNVIRALTRLAVDALEALIYLSPFNDAADRLWNETSSPAHGSAGDDRPPRSVCDPDVERGGLPTSMADTLERLDIVQDELERVQRENGELRLYAARDIARLNSELSQAVAQRDIARNQRDDARAQLFGMTP